MPVIHTVRILFNDYIFAAGFRFQPSINKRAFNCCHASHFFYSSHSSSYKGDGIEDECVKAVTSRVRVETLISKSVPVNKHDMIVTLSYLFIAALLILRMLNFLFCIYNIYVSQKCLVQRWLMRIF